MQQSDKTIQQNKLNMNAKKNRFPILNKWISIIKDIISIFYHEFKTVFKDRGVVIIFILASLIYPLLYCGLYKNETLVNVPIAAVDYSNTQRSRELLRHLDASPDVKINKYSTLDEGKKAFDNRKVHGLVFIPADFNNKLINGEQTTVSIYCDMSSFLYYRSLTMASSYSILDMGNKIQVERLNAQGITGQNATIVSNPIPFESNILFNEGMGFASFLMPAILILIIHQTLFFGIGMLAGTSRGENRFHELVSSKFHRGETIRVIIGKAACYMLMYLVFSFYILQVIPHIFNLPHIGNPLDLLKFMIPFLMATIFFSMTISVFLPNRETGMIIFLFFSLILLFLSGISWPQSNINGFWKTFAWIFPSTHGIQGYIKINTMSADLHHVKYEYVSLWVQTAIYFVTTLFAYRWQIKKSEKKQLLKEISLGN
jgi:ABC-2 type transport system permease protein